MRYVEGTILYCQYCNTKENLVIKKSDKRTIHYSVCQDHWEQYQLDRVKIREKTNLEKYGYSNLMDSPEIIEKQKNYYKDKSEEEKNKIKEKRAKTNIEKFGSECCFTADSFREDYNATMLERYGTTISMNVPEFKQKYKQTLLDRYGVDTPLKNKDSFEKMKKTNLEKYGYEFPISNPDIKNKARSTLMKNYGVTEPSYSKEIMDKIRKNNLEKYGKEYVCQTEEIKNRIISTNKALYWDMFNKVLKMQKIIPLFDKEYYIDLNNKIFKYKCLRCNKEFESEKLVTKTINCGCLASRSSYEDDIIDWLKSINIINIDSNRKFFNGDRKRFEIDVYLKDQNLGIDFDGLYWHSDIKLDKNYHQNKYLFFKELEIPFIQIFENEWKQKEEVVKSIIKNKLGMNERIFARKCIIKEITYKEKHEFLELNHLQGDTVSKINIGLFYKDEIVAIGTFGKNRFKKEDSWELIRFCNKINFTVIGGFQKILQFFKKGYNPNKLISFVDLRYFDGRGYKQAGFEEIEITKPDYFYFIPNKDLHLQHRTNFQKHKLKDKLKIFDESKTEYENMIDNDYLRIFDAGNLKMELTYII